MWHHLRRARSTRSTQVMSHSSSSRRQLETVASQNIFSNKHNIYGYKVEISVLPNDQPVGCLNPQPGLVAYIELMPQNMVFHHRALSIEVSEGKLIEYMGELIKYHPGFCYFISDKGYQVLSEAFPAVWPKTPIRGCLSSNYYPRNNTVSTEKIIVDNVLGRLCSYWIVLSTNYRCA